MRRIIVFVILIFFLTFPLLGFCNEKERFVVVRIQRMAYLELHIIRDTESGSEYLIVRDWRQGGLTAIPLILSPEKQLKQLFGDEE